MDAETALAVLLAVSIIAAYGAATHLIRVLAQSQKARQTAAEAEAYANDPDNAVRSWLWPERN